MAHAQDVDGRPFVNERVCFNVDSKADGVFGYSGTLTPTLTIGGAPAPPKGRSDVCRLTDVNGNAAVEVLNSDPEVINVIADYDPEGLLRSIDVDFRGPATPPADPFKPGRPPVTTGGARSRPPPTEAEEAGIPPTAGSAAVRRRPSAARITSARLVKRHGKVYLVVKVKSSTRYARLRVKVLGKHGRKLSTVAKRVRTNRTVKLRLSAKARSARVSLVR